MRATTGPEATERALLLALSIAVLSSFAMTACSSSEGCTTARDCESGRRCEMHQCVLPPSGGRLDSGIHDDAEVAPPDTGMHADAEVDGGTTTTDAEVDGGGATMDGSIDGGVPTNLDAGPVTGGDAGSLPSGGRAVYAELTVGATPTVFAWATFLDNGGVTYSQTTQRFPSADGSACTLTSTRLLAGTPTGITAQSIVFRHDSGQTRELDPDPAQPGRFVLAGAAQAGFFGSLGNVTLEVHSNGTPGTLADYAAMASSPGFMQASQPAGNPVAIPAGVHLAWIGAMTSPVVELADASREVVLVCSPTFGTSQYDIPLAAIQAWIASAPTRPASLELRNDIVRQADIPLEGGGTLPATFRLSRGTRWDVTF